jgi:hypothetical protein
MNRTHLLIILHLLLVIDLCLIVIVQRNMSRFNAKSSQLGRSQRAVWVGDEREHRDVGELLEQLIPLALNDLLVTPHNLNALIHHIQTLISVPACGKDTPEHFKMPELVLGAEGAPPLQVVREGAAGGAEEKPA